MHGMDVSAISPVGASLVPISPVGASLVPISPVGASLVPISVRSLDPLREALTLGGDAGAAVQEYGAVALLPTPIVHAPVVTGSSRPLVSAPSPIAGIALTRIDTYA
jgi:hypothetical protein